MGVHKSGGKKRSDISLQMECAEDELSPAQLAYYNKAETEYQEFMAKAEAAIKNANGELIESGEHIKLWQLNSLMPAPVINTMCKSKTTPKPITSVASPLLRSSAVPIQTAVQMPNPSLVLQNNVTTSGALVNRTSPVINPAAPQYQLVVDPRIGLLVGSVPQPTTSTATVTVPPGAVLQPVPPTLTAITPAQTITSNITPVRGRPTTQVTGTTPQQTKQTNGTFTKLQGNTVNTPSGGSGMSNIRISTKVVAGKSPMTTAKNTPMPTAINSKTPTNVKFRPNEASSIGGVGPKAALAAAKAKASATLVDLTSEDKADSKEVTFNKLSGKTFPSLVVVARPNLKLKELTQANINQQRTYLDGKVKQVLIYTPTKFTEWLIQQGLVRSEQYCSIHINPDMSPVKLKLGMYSDVSKFPYSGGYVWISDCCPQRFVSVFSGSVFEGAPHAPTMLLKLIYHWSCQTNVQNITQWVKIDNFYVKSFFTNLRSICTAAVHEKFEKLGGNKKKVEVGVISLGTTSQDGNMRQVKVEVLGVMERDTKMIRLRAVEPLQDGERNYKRRFVKILEPLEQWVDKDSIILTDCTVDKGTLHNMGYRSVYQVAATDTTPGMRAFSNSNVMEYLRRIVPRMFQNTLSLLSRQIIQQFLDELVWRERWGYIAAQCFDTMILHLAEQTKLDTGDTLMARLSKIAANPFKNWSYANWKTNSSSNSNMPPAQRQILPAPPDPSTNASTNSSIGQKRIRKPTNTVLPGEPEPKKMNTNPGRTTSFSNTELRPLDSYYYGIKPGDEQILAEQKTVQINMKCCVCQRLMKDNISMMKHLIDHAYNEGTYINSEPTPICRYCPFKLSGFPSDFAIQNHIEESHIKMSGSLMCLICEEKFRDRTTLILHMHHNHNELELPYECGICKMRSSQHSVIIDHFYEIHKDSDKIQCPYCLKIVAIETNGRKMTQNLYFYLNHIQKHQRKTIARKCPKCTLWFVHKGILKDHQNKYHNTCKELEGIVRSNSSAMDIIMMPTPLENGVQVPKTTQKNKQNLINMFTLNAFESLTIHYGKQEGAHCCECEGDFQSEDHFPGYLSCLKCRFSTCCNKAMQEHIVIYHDKVTRPEFNVGKIIMLEKPLHCVCGFSTRSGNKLAKHLTDCRRKSAYPSAERAVQNTMQGQSASFPPLVTLDDQETEEMWQRSYVQRNENNESSDKTEKPANIPTNKDPPSMLNILGLVRKTSVDESSQDKVVSDGENGSTTEPTDKTSSKSEGTSQENTMDETEAVKDQSMKDVLTIKEDTVDKDEQTKMVSEKHVAEEKVSQTPEIKEDTVAAGDQNILISEDEAEDKLIETPPPKEDPIGEVEQNKLLSDEQTEDNLLEPPKDETVVQGSPEETDNKDVLVVKDVADVATEQPADLATEQPADVATEKPADIATEQPADVATEQPADVMGDTSAIKCTAEETPKEISTGDEDKQDKAEETSAMEVSEIEEGLSTLESIEVSEMEEDLSTLESIEEPLNSCEPVAELMDVTEEPV